jgi:hypothetical protein
MNSKHVKEREPSTKPVEVLLPDKTVIHGTFLLWNEVPNNRKLGRIVFRLKDSEFSASNVSFFHALRDIRLELEKENLLLKCYGSSRQVWPSGMGLSMTRGEKSYRHYFGKKGDIKDVVSIFDSGSDVDPCTFEEQRQFHQQWLLSIGIDPNKEVYPWKALFASQPFKTAVLFFNKKILKRGKKLENVKA